jgi:tetratricopeptide (TPR) repeat protein
MNRFIISTCLILTISIRLPAQSREDYRNNFYDAESWIVYEAYKDALPLYLQLLRAYPDNSNFKYRVGQCYLNIPGEKKKAISYLEEAVKNIDPAYKERKFNESGAPSEALFYLASAYHINNQLDNAIKTYELFLSTIDPALYDTSTVRFQILTCRNASNLMNKPVILTETNTGSVINGRSNEFNPAISDKEDLIVFSRSTPFYDAIMFSKKENDRWTEPSNLNEVFKIDRDLYPASLSGDGKVLYLYSAADYDGALYTSNYENGRWKPVVKLNDNINTKYWESHAIVSHDNKRLYFTSNRRGGFGGLDIFVSIRDSSGNWGPATNLGPKINTVYNEESPFLTVDDKTLFFSSRGHYNMGGYDIFYSTLQDNGEWSEPVNPGYPLNTTDDDIFYRPVGNGKAGYIARDLKNGNGGLDIYRVEIKSPEHAQVAAVMPADKDVTIIPATTEIRNDKQPPQTAPGPDTAISGKSDYQTKGSSTIEKEKTDQTAMHVPALKNETMPEIKSETVNNQDTINTPVIEKSIKPGSVKPPYILAGVIISAIILVIILFLYRKKKK